MNENTRDIYVQFTLRTFSVQIGYMLLNLFQATWSYITRLEYGLLF